MSSSQCYVNVKPNVLNQFARARDFRSLRWRMALPLLFIVLGFAMLTTYAVSSGITRGLRQAQMDRLLLSTRAVDERAVAFGDSQRRELTRIAYTQGVPDAVAAADAPKLQSLLQPLAAAARFDYLIIGSADAHELIGLQRTASGYGATQGAALKALPFVSEVLSGGLHSASGIVHTDHGYALMTASPILRKDSVVGVAVAGALLDQVAASLRGSSLTDLAFYGPNGELLYRTLNADSPDQFGLSSGTLKQALYTADQVPISSLQFSSGSYYAAYVPLIVESAPIGVLGILEPNGLFLATESSRNLLSLSLSVLAGTVTLSAFGLMTIGLRRLTKVTTVARALASGNRYARTEMKATDEIGELGRNLDMYARRTQKQTDSLELSLRQQRRETTRISAVLESIPNGVIVQDLDGRVVLMNTPALTLLGSQRAFRSSPLNELTAMVTDTLGAALAPGIYTLGDPQRVPMDGKMLHAQAAAVLALSEKRRIGTVIVLRDITDEVRREQERNAMLNDLARDVRNPLTAKMPPGSTEDALKAFIREVNHNAIALQRMISEIRDLSTTDAKGVKAGQRALPVEPLLWNLTSEWQPVAQSHGVELHLMILRRGLHVLGDERRLRWGIGNLIDNAIKYTPKGGHITLMLLADDDDHSARFSLRDTGVGISEADMPHIFTRFYRGKPADAQGRLLQTPGTGQGLFIAQRVIEAHGGTLGISSEPHQGTEVTFALPLTADITLDVSRHAPLPVVESELQYNSTLDYSISRLN